MRVLRKDRGFTITAALTLALGIGAATTIFSVVHKVLLEPLNYSDPDRLVMVRERLPQILPDPIPVPAPDVFEIQRETEVFQDAAGWRSEQRDLSSDAGTPARVPVTKVMANLFPLLGAQPALGRTFTVEEDRSRQSVAILSDTVWRTRYASDPRILGRTILLDRVPHAVIGVMPPSFTFPPQGLAGSEPADVWVPMAFTDVELQTYGDDFNTAVLARLKHGVSAKKAESVLAGTARRIFEKYAAISKKEFSLEVIATPLRDRITGGVRTLVLMLAGAVFLLLMIACGNVANLMLTRAARREREFAIRTAIGASRSTVARQWLIESVLLALIGGIGGVFLAWYGTDALARMTAVNLPRLAEVRLDLRALVVSVVLSVLTGLIFGAAPAFFSGRSDLTQALKEGGRGTIGRGRRRLRPALAVVEVALALVLLAGAGLLIRSFLRVRATDPGFQTENLVTMNLSLPAAMYRSPSDVRGFIERLDEKLRRIPGVMAVGAGNGLPLERAEWIRVFSIENETTLRGKRPPTAFTVIDGDYFQALGIALKLGRLFTAADRNEQAPVLIVSETMARTLWPGDEPIGKLIKFAPPGSKTPFHTVVGVVADVKEDSLERESKFRSYVPAAQIGGAVTRALNTPGFVVRARKAPETVMAAVREAVQSIDPQMPVAKLQTMDQRLDGTLSARRIQMYVVALFASAALLLSALGVYGVIAYSVAERTQEIGIRMALGATRSGVLRMVVQQGLVMTAVGIVAGLAGSAVLTRMIESLLFGVKPTDAATFAVVAGVLLAAAAVASLLPARRAMSVDPMVALRRE